MTYLVNNGAWCHIIHSDNKNELAKLIGEVQLVPLNTILNIGVEDGRLCFSHSYLKPTSNTMTSFKIGDKVTIGSNKIYTIKYLGNKNGVVLEGEDLEEWWTNTNNLELYKPPIFSYFHTLYGLHNWTVGDIRTADNKVCITAVDTNTIFTYVPVELVDHYIGNN